MMIDEQIKARFNDLHEKSFILEQRITPDSDGQLSYPKDCVEDVRKWGMQVLFLLRSIFGENSDQYTYFKKSYDRCGSAAFDFRICKGLFLAAMEDYSNGYLINLQFQILSGFIGDELDQAEELLDEQTKNPTKTFNKDIACILCRIGLESAIKKLCDREGIQHDKSKKLNILIEELKKANVYNEGMRKQVAAWADRGNAAAHGNYAEYNHQDVKYMLDGIRNFIVFNL